jgi:hypothetical protein
MKPGPTRPIREEAPWSRLDCAFRTVIKVPKEALLKEWAKLKQARTRKKQAKKHP